MSDDDLKPAEALVKSQAPGLLEKIPKQDRPKLYRLLIEQQKLEIKSYSGPIPSPGQLREFEAILPGLANRLVTMAENQSAHRIETEKFVVNSQQRQSGVGQYLGFIISVLAICGGIYLAVNGHPGVGGTLTSGTVISLATIFVLGKRQQRKDLGEKRIIPKNSGQN